MRKTDLPDPGFEGHIVEYLITSYHCPFGRRGKLYRKALTDEEYRQVRNARRAGELKIRSHARVGETPRQEWQRNRIY